jgi:hypothetical protein
MQSTVAVRIGPCACPGAPHEDGDVVNLRERLGLAQGVQLQSAIISAGQSGLSAPAITGVLGEQYLIVGVESWNLVDDKGKAIPVTPEMITEHLLSDFERGTVAADKADELYATRYVVPLVNRAANSSPSTTTGGPTSVIRNGGGTKRHRPSKQSSTTTTEMAVTATTSS